MGKQILIILGGGRPKGNTAQLVAAFTQGAEAAGHTVETLSLMKNEVKGCLGCNACRYGKPCVQRDAFNGLVPKIKAADCIVFASPLYFWTLSARIKAFIERFYCIAEEDPAPPLGRYEKYPVKDCALLMTAADNFFWTFQQAESYYKFAVVITSVFMIGECCWRAAAETPMVHPRLAKQTTWNGPLLLDRLCTLQKHRPDFWDLLCCILINRLGE